MENVNKMLDRIMEVNKRIIAELEELNAKLVNSLSLSRQSRTGSR